jgi:hypothetical protein
VEGRGERERDIMRDGRVDQAGGNGDDYYWRARGLGLGPGVLTGLGLWACSCVVGSGVL